MNEEYFISKMYPSGFASYVELTKKANDFLASYPNVKIKLYESSEMKQAASSKQPLSIVAGQYRPTNATQFVLCFIIKFKTYLHAQMSSHFCIEFCRLCL